MPQLKGYVNLNDDLISYISANYSNHLPNSLLIAQAFILKYPQYGRKYGLSVINRAIEDYIKSESFKNRYRENTKHIFGLGSNLKPKLKKINNYNIKSRYKPLFYKFRY